jgi:hypothetical protein
MMEAPSVLFRVESPVVTTATPHFLNFTNADRLRPVNGSPH